jgi:hypothetical protein
MASSFNAGSFIGRLLFAGALVIGTYNPTGHSYIGWALSQANEFGPPHAIVGILLLTGWIVFLRATFLSIGWLGIVLGAAFCASLVWLMVEQGWVALDSGDNLTWVVLTVLSVVLAIGLSWSHVRRRMTGQVDVDDVDDD